MRYGCPVTIAFIEHAKRCVDPIIHEGETDYLNELQNVARELPASVTLNRLRAFYCIERLHSISRALQGRSDLPQLFFETRRSHEGLSNLLEQVALSKDDLLGEAVALSLEMRQGGSAKALAQLTKHTRRMNEEVVLKLEESAKLLRRSLSNEDVNLSRVGTYTATALHLCSGNLLDTARKLVTISETNALNGWGIDEPLFSGVKGWA